MKHITLLPIFGIFTFFTTCIILSCRTTKEKSELLRMNTKAQSVSSTNTSWMQLNRQDSTHSYWHYISDSTFFFHPDSGLWSHSGELIYMSRGVNKREESGADYSLQNLKREASKVEAEVRSVRTKNYRSIGIVVLSIIVVFVFLIVIKKVN